MKKSKHLTALKDLYFNNTPTLIKGKKYKVTELNNWAFNVLDEQEVNHTFSLGSQGTKYFNIGELLD